MPPITLHMVLARQVSRHLSDASVDAAEGPYLLGATSPDIRVLTRQNRTETHFFDLNGPDHQDSVGAFLETHEHLVEPGRLNAETRAFVAGYISHLVMDEQYITGIYRPYFARHEELGGIVRANLMDRLLQFDLDRTYGDEPRLVKGLLQALACTVETIECGFIDHETLEKWRQITCDVAARNMDWDRMRAMASNHLKRSGIDETTELGDFLDSIPDLLDETIAHVSEAEIHAFIERSGEAAARAIERYLQCG
jgi:hypothetical protein